MKPRPLIKKVLAPRKLQKLLARKKRVVFTNGCFDLLHKGHVTYLERARKLGDILVVAVNSDESVRRLKGAGRPINELADRMEVLAALESVDYVTFFEENTPENLIRLLHPHVLVKGGDWKPEQILGSADVLGWGGKVRSLPYVEGRSTTKMIERSRG
ncbi:MAG: D-glycero-beta-D-manno-heptose 1-phosphate adenylyltransferase [Bdellovibrionota bacterium]